jgi:type III restriction enzyme
MTAPIHKLKLGTGDLILNSPFDEPDAYWTHDRSAMVFTRMSGRRPAGYVVAAPQTRGFDDPGVFMPLTLANAIRPRVKAWREAGYPGVTTITRRLLDHWQDADQREGRRFFFCQIEAIETLIWLAEAPAEDTAGIDVPGDGGDFSRWCTKLATGTGKTVVMAMLIAWQVLNRVTYRHDERYAKDVFIVAPGLTVRDRLKVLVPDAPGNYYTFFEIVPPGLEEKLRQGRVRVANWHTLGIETEAQLAKVRSVDQRRRMARSDERYLRDVLGDLADARNLIVINDEAHHAWRVNPEVKVKGVSKSDVEEATKWVRGLDRIHATRGILRCFDFSATPFAPSGRKSSEEAVFPWIVSDFGLNDAIESGLVKTPRVVVRDDGTLTRELKSRFYHVYREPDVQADLNRKAEPHEPLPDLVTTAYTLLGADWLATARAWKDADHPVPPVLITVANRTETAARVKFMFDGERIPISELCDPERTLHIDSKVLGQAEAQEQAGEVDAPPGEDDGDDEDPASVASLTKHEQAELLRRTVGSVGQIGQPGEQVQNVISVGMLSEGWDAKTVTHIMGLRAFTSQLLCEQVVGRGLRRTEYEPYTTEDGRQFFRPEHVNIFGVPFTFLPHENEEVGVPEPPPPKRLVMVLPERERDFGISWPNIVRIDTVYRSVLNLDIAAVSPLVLNASDTPTMAELAAILEGKPNLEALREIDVESIVQNHRFQTILFKVARGVFEQMEPSWTGQRDVLVSQLIRLTEAFLASDRIQMRPQAYADIPAKRRLMLMLNMNRIIGHFWIAIRQTNAAERTPVFDPEQPVRGTRVMSPWYTARPCQPTVRSHVNLATFDSTWEASEAFSLERNDLVQAWVKNDHLGFEIWYVFRGARRRYRPDFLVRLTNGVTLVLETKGRIDDESNAKHEYLAEWIDAVNAHGGFGRWAWDVSTSLDDVVDILARHAEPSA